MLFVRHVPAPTLRLGDVVIMDNLPIHKRASVRDMIEARACGCCSVVRGKSSTGACSDPSNPNRPDVNPIEMAFARLKRLLKKSAERPADGLWEAIGQIVDCYTPQEWANYFAAWGYDAH